MNIKTLVIIFGLLLSMHSMVEGKTFDPEIYTEWTESEIYMMCEIVNGDKSDKYSDGIFDCKEWTWNHNKWTNAQETDLEGPFIVEVLYTLNNMRETYALSLRISHGLYIVVDAQSGYYICANGTASLKEAIVSILIQVRLDHRYEEIHGLDMILHEM